MVKYYNLARSHGIICACLCAQWLSVCLSCLCECFAGCLAWLLRIVYLLFACTAASSWCFVCTCFFQLAFLSICTFVHAPFNCGFVWSLPNPIPLACSLPSLLAQWAFVIVGVYFHLVVSGSLCPFPCICIIILCLSRAWFFVLSLCALACGACT